MDLKDQIIQEYLNTGWGFRKKATRFFADGLLVCFFITYCFTSFTLSFLSPWLTVKNYKVEI